MERLSIKEFFFWPHFKVCGQKLKENAEGKFQLTWTILAVWKTALLAQGGASL